MIQSRPDGTEQKINLRGPSKYSPPILCDDVVNSMARHFYTSQEIADRYSINRATLMALHGEAYRAGKADLLAKPRQVRMQAMKDLHKWSEDTGLGWGHPDAPFDRMNKLAEVIENKYGPSEEVVAEENPMASKTPEELEAMMTAWALANGFEKKV